MGIGGTGPGGWIICTSTPNTGSICFDGGIIVYASAPDNKEDLQKMIEKCLLKNT